MPTLDRPEALLLSLLIRSRRAPSWPVAWSLMALDGEKCFFLCRKMADWSRRMPGCPLAWQLQPGGGTRLPCRSSSSTWSAYAARSHRFRHLLSLLRTDDSSTRLYFLEPVLSSALLTGRCEIRSHQDATCFILKIVQVSGIAPIFQGWEMFLLINLPAKEAALPFFSCTFQTLSSDTYQLMLW